MDKRKSDRRKMPQRNPIVETETMVLFWQGWPSQWYPSPFAVDGVPYTHAEQYMMAEKARLFGDEATRARILAAETPSEQKGLGRKVEGFVQATWEAEAQEIVYRGNLAKFSQNHKLRKLLLATGEKRLVEASPLDRIWGIGLHADDPRSRDESQWLGKNWLGNALERVRTTLRAQQEAQP